MHAVADIFIILVSAWTINSESTICPCSTSTLCSVNKRKFNPEIVVVAEGKTDHSKWLWNEISTVIAMESVPESEAKNLMCTAHQNHANFAFVREVPMTTNTSDPILTDWLKETADMEKMFYADYIALDLLKLLGQCKADSSHVQEVLSLLTFMITNYFTPPGAELLCIVPYKPPCYDGDCSLSQYMAKHCAAFITSPESFTTCDTNPNCIAKATIPMTSLVFGVEEYIDHGLTPDKLLIGIPWHGYDYTCINYTTNKKTGSTEQLTCYFDEINTSKTCNMTLRKKLSLAEIKSNYPEQYKNSKSHHYHPIYRSDYINVQKEGQQHQIWYEGHDSLLDKYMYIRSMEFKGMVIWTADDLSAKGIDDGTEWNWILHSLFSKGEIQEKSRDMAGIVAGISVGCFVLGSFLGFAFGCAVMRKRMHKKGLRLPFQRDDEETDFHDDDNTL
uniref:Di-N-acetylchitobiase-like isoform X2 n=1 Tax=Crassostrea virginica TaxID=6565 RepID=A0A8B8EZ32_CRAVI|nr:di-N-acetylchitobiase-like isoform X2 [Crassostrea virginica]